MPDIAPLLDQWFIDTREEREPDGLLHPSSMSGCWRQAVYEAQGVEPSDVKDVRNYRIMWFGTELHELLQEALRDLPAFESEIKVEPEGWPFAGSADGMYVVGDGPEYELLEFKSISPFALKKKDMPRTHHVEQARMYAWGLNKHGIRVEWVRIVYVSRDDMAMREFVLERDTDWEADFEDRLRMSQSLFLGEGKTSLPPRLDEDSPEAWLCKYCSFRTRCYDQDEDTRRVD